MFAEDQPILQDGFKETLNCSWDSRASRIFPASTHNWSWPHHQCCIYGRFSFQAEFQNTWFYSFVSMTFSKHCSTLFEDAEAIIIRVWCRDTLCYEFSNNLFREQNKCCSCKAHGFNCLQKHLIGFIRCFCNILPRKKSICFFVLVKKDTCTFSGHFLM